MKNLRTLSSFGWIMIAAIAISLAGCAVKKAPWGNTKKGMTMKYQAPPDKTLNYRTTASFEQEMEVMENKIRITANSDQLLEMMPITDKSNDLDYMVTIAELASNITTPKGDVVAKTEDVIGKSFNLTLSQYGEELDYSGAENIIYDYGTGDTKSISSEIQSFFPNLPGYSVKPGDSWESTDKVTEKSSSGILNIEFNNVNTFEKIEIYKGYDCMKINVVFDGILEGTAEQEGMQLITSGTIAGTGIWYFAYKEGLLIAQESAGTGITNTEVKGPQEMTLPATREFVMKSFLE